MADSDMPRILAVFTAIALLMASLAWCRTRQPEEAAKEYMDTIGLQGSVVACSEAEIQDGWVPCYGRRGTGNGADIRKFRCDTRGWGCE